MLCPKCKYSKLKVLDSRSDGPGRQIRSYKCPSCDYETWNIEELPKNHGRGLPGVIAPGEIRDGDN